MNLPLCLLGGVGFIEFTGDAPLKKALGEGSQASDHSVLISTNTRSYSRSLTQLLRCFLGLHHTVIKGPVYTAVPRKINVELTVRASLGILDNSATTENQFY